MFKYFETQTNRNCTHDVITARLIMEFLLAFTTERSTHIIPFAIRKYKD